MLRVEVKLEKAKEGALITRGKNKGKTRVKAKSGGRLMLVLRDSTTHKEDPALLPPSDELARAATFASRDFIESFA